MKKYIEEDFTELNETFDKMPYELQLLKKQEKVREFYSRNKFSVEPMPIIPNPQPLNYRHKVIVSATNIKANGKYKLCLGLFKEGSKFIIPGVVNHIHDIGINHLLVTIESILQKYKIEAYSQKSFRGMIKHILVRKSYNDKTMMVVFVTQGHIFPNHKAIINEILSKHPLVKTVVQNIHKIDTPVVMLEKNLILYGPGYIEDQIGNLRFRLSPNSFFQINPLQMINLYKCAVDFADIQPNDFVMDCYSGIGTLSLIAALKAKEVIAIESSGQAIKDAIINKKLNNFNNVDFQLSNVEDYMFDYDKKVDVLIMDPARDGADEKFINAIRKLLPKRIVYISCFIESQIRDLLLLKDLYVIDRVQPVDMFSFTSHIETVTRLTLK